MRGRAVDLDLLLAGYLTLMGKAVSLGIPPP